MSEVAIAVAAVAMQALNMYSQSQQVKAQNRVRKAQADAEDVLRPARNQAAAAQNSLSLWSQSVNNKRRARTVGLQMEADTVNSGRRRDTGLSQAFSGGIRSAERAGAQAAAAASSGVSGNVVDMVAGATALRRKIGEQAVANTENMADYDMRRRAAELSHQLVTGMDTSTVMSGMDYNGTILQQQHAQSTGMILGNAAASLGAIFVGASGDPEGGNPKPEPQQEKPLGSGVQLGEQGGNIGGGFWGSSSRGLLLGGK